MGSLALKCMSLSVQRVIAGTSCTTLDLRMAILSRATTLSAISRVSVSPRVRSTLYPYYLSHIQIIVVLYDVIEHVKRSFTLNAYSSILQRSIEDVGGRFKIRRGVFSNLFVSFCNQIRSSPTDQVCGSVGTSGARVGCLCDTISIDGCQFAPQMQYDDGAVDTRETVHVPRQLQATNFFAIPDSGTRQLLLRWAGLPPKGPPTKEAVNFSREDNDRLVTYVRRSASFLGDLLEFATLREWIGVPRDDKPALEFFQLFVTSVACAHPSYPVITGFQPGKFEALNAVAIAFEDATNMVGFSAHVVALATHGVPAFGDLVSHTFLHSCDPSERRTLLHLLGTTLRTLVQTAASYHEAVSASRSSMPPLVRREISREEDRSHGACFPPENRLRFEHKVDWPSESSHGAATSGRPTCEYYYKTNPFSTFLPCIVLIWCMCGINRGFQILRKRESVTTIINMLVERFKKMPRRVYYDFSCGLLRSICGAAPWHFEETAFCHDPMHGKGHCSTCSAAFDVKFVVDPDVRSHNAVIAEQRNSRIREWDRTIMFMTFTNATILMSVLLASMNADCRHKTQGEVSSQLTRSAAVTAVLPTSPTPVDMATSPAASYSLRPAAPSLSHFSVAARADVHVAELQPPLSVPCSMLDESAAAVVVDSRLAVGGKIELSVDGDVDDEPEDDDECGDISRGMLAPVAVAEDTRHDDGGDEYLSDDGGAMSGPAFVSPIAASSSSGEETGAVGQKRARV